MSFYVTLAALIAAPEYTNLSDVEAAAVVTAKTLPGVNAPVQIADLMVYLRTNSLWLPIKAAAATGNPAAAAAVDINEDTRARTIDMSLEVVHQLLGGLVQSQLLTQDQADTIIAMGAPPVSWMQHTLGVPYISEADIRAARTSPEDREIVHEPEPAEGV